MCENRQSVAAHAQWRRGKIDFDIKHLFDANMVSI